MQTNIDGIKKELETPKHSKEWESYFAMKADHYEILAHQRGEEIKRLNKIIDKLQ